jgi:hypothetical protein
MAKFGESTARQLPEEKKPDLRVIEGGADEEFIPDEDVKDVRSRKSSPPSRAKVLRRAKHVAEAPVIPDEEVRDVVLPKAKEKRISGLKKSTPEERAQFEEERAAERAELEQIRQDVMGRLEAIEHRIVGNREAADKAVAEREKTEADSAQELAQIEGRAMVREEVSRRQHEEMAEPMREVARQFGREQALAGRMKEEGEMESQLEINEKGHVSGIKNIPYLDAGAVHLALPAMWKKHDMERTWLNKNRPAGWERLLKDLDLDAERMAQMREKADELIDSGQRDARVRNFFYQYEGAAAVKGMDQAKVETLLVSPEQVLADKEKKLGEENAAIEEAIEEVYDVSRQVDAFLEGKQNEIDHATELVEIDDSLIKGMNLRLVNLQAEHDLNHKMQQPENLDVHGGRLQAAYERAKGMIETKKKELATFKGGGEKRTDILAEIGEHEFNASEAQKQLTEWKGDPARARVMGYRLEALQDEAADLSDQIMQSQHLLKAAEEHKIQYEGKTEMIVRGVDEKNLPELIDLADDKMQYLLREKARVQREMSDIRRARIMQEAPSQGDEEDVDFEEGEYAEVREDELIEEEPTRKAA